MGIQAMLWRWIRWPYMKRRLGYTAAEMKTFRSRPRNHDVLEQAPKLLRKMIIAEVVEAHGCNSRHQVGDRFCFDYLGNLLTDPAPAKVCIHALHAMTPQIFAANELLYAGADPNGMRFNRAACFDPGLACGGVGHIVMEIKVMDIKD